MKRIASTLIVAALFAIPAVLAQNGGAKSHHKGGHHGTNVTASGTSPQWITNATVSTTSRHTGPNAAAPSTSHHLRTNVAVSGTSYSEGTNVTVSGILSLQTGTVSTVTSTGTNVSVVAGGETNEASEVIGGGKPFTVYVLTMADGTEVRLASRVADACPVKLSDYLNKSVTIVGTGRIMDGRSDKSVKVVSIYKITSVTGTGATPPAATP